MKFSIEEAEPIIQSPYDWQEPEEALELVEPITIPYKFTPRNYQFGIMGACPEKFKRAIFVHHRRAGKDKAFFNKAVMETQKKSAVYYYFFPTYAQGRKVIWDSIDPRTGTKFSDHIPREILRSVDARNMQFIFQNRSVLQIIGTDSFNSIMGTPPYGVFFSEFSLQDPRAWDLIRPILRENGGFAMFNFTPRGQNHAFRLYQFAKNNPKWYVEVLTIKDTKREDGTPVISESDIEEDRMEGMPEELIQQEYYCSFTGYNLGVYYGKQMAKAEDDGRICGVPYDTGMPVNTAWDLGVDDSTSIIFFQEAGEYIHVIDYYENFGEGAEHYAAILKEKGFFYGDHFFPHDVAQREWLAGKSREETLLNLGIKPIIKVPRASNSQAVMEGIQNVRNFLARCKFDKEKCRRLLESLREYRANYNDKLKKLEDHPCHDWASHAADAMRCLAVGWKPRIPKIKSWSERIYGG